MRFLLDTHLLIWSAGHEDRLSTAARGILDNTQNVLIFSSISIYEVTIKAAQSRDNFRIDPLAFHKMLMESGFEELPFQSHHALAVMRLPQLHRDPFDRALIGQAIAEDLTLLTADSTIARYPAPIRQV